MIAVTKIGVFFETTKGLGYFLFKNLHFASNSKRTARQMLIPMTLFTGCYSLMLGKAFVYRGNDSASAVLKASSCARVLSLISFWSARMSSQIAAGVATTSGKSLHIIWNQSKILLPLHQIF